MFIQKQNIEEDLVSTPIIGDNLTANTYTKRIDFAIPYIQPPYIQLSVERLDCGSRIEQSGFVVNGKRLLHTVTRYDISAQDISGTGFTLKISTWGGDAIYGFRVAWVAFGERVPETRSTAEEMRKNFLQYLAQEIKDINQQNGTHNT